MCYSHADEAIVGNFTTKGKMKSQSETDREMCGHDLPVYVPAGPRKFTIILLYPDYVRDHDGETWCGHGVGTTVAEAVTNAQKEVAEQCEINNPTDLLPIAVFEGEHHDLVSEWEFDVSQP